MRKYLVLAVLFLSGCIPPVVTPPVVTNTPPLVPTDIGTDTPGPVTATFTPTSSPEPSTATLTATGTSTATVTATASTEPSATVVPTKIPPPDPGDKCFDGEENRLVNPCFSGNMYGKNSPFGWVMVNGEITPQNRVYVPWNIYFSAPPSTENQIPALPWCSEAGQLSCNSVGTYDEQPEFKPETVSNFGAGGGNGQQWFLQHRPGIAGISQTFNTGYSGGGDPTCHVWVHFETKSEWNVGSGDYPGLFYSIADEIDPAEKFPEGQDRDNYIANQTRLLVDTSGGTDRWNIAPENLVVSKTLYGDYAYTLLDLHFEATGPAATVFFETDRQWGLPYQDIVAYDAGAICYGEDVNEPTPVLPTPTPVVPLTPLPTLTSDCGTVPGGIYFPDNQPRVRFYNGMQGRFCPSLADEAKTGVIVPAGQFYTVTQEYIPQAGELWVQIAYGDRFYWIAWVVNGIVFGCWEGSCV